uniref:Gag1-like clamp domain-containing protein n=1 Tax=Davidia involucrata TaxID=16924 RepID=A0A5B7A604_DAVIN
MMVLYGSFTSWISDCLACMGSCLGRCAKPSPIIAVDEPSKGLRIQGRTVKKPSVSEDFWSTSTCEMDNSAVQSQRSISSISISNQSLSHCSGTGSTSNPSEFINHGLLLWNQTRLQWIGSKRSENQGKVRALGLSRNTSYESLLGTNKRFSRPIPLAEMVDCLVDIWEQEGLYD